MDGNPSVRGNSHFMNGNPSARGNYFMNGNPFVGWKSISWMETH
jgi:hypothetical protein